MADTGVPISIPIPELSPTPEEPTQTPTPFPSPTPILPDCSEPQTVLETIPMELFGNLQSMGITVTLPDNNDLENDAVAFVEYRKTEEEFQTGFSLTRIDETRFVGSLFWLQPGTSYEVKVTFLDPQSSLNCAIVFGKGSTRGEAVIPESIRILYASPDGRGDSCIKESPCSFTEALVKSGPGTKILLRGGVYHEGEINIVRGGEEGSPLIIRSYPGESAIFDGAVPDRLQWKAHEAGIYSAELKEEKPNLVFAGDERLYPYTNMEDLGDLYWDLFGYTTDGNTLYVHLTNDADPNSIPMFISRFSYALWVSGGNTYLLNLTFRHYAENRYQQGAVHLESDDNLIQGNIFASTHAGIAVEPGADRNLIQENNFSDAVFDWPWDAVYGLYANRRRNRLTNLAGNAGIRFINGDPIARGNVIRRNIFHDTFDGLQVCPNQKDAAGTNETDIYDNLIHHVTDDGMETDGYCSNVRIWGNTFHDMLVGISLAPARTGPVYVIRNILYDFGSTRYPPFSNQAPCCGNSIKFNTSEKGTGAVYLLHNTVSAYVNSPGIGLASDYPPSLIYSRNNIWLGKGREAINIDLHSEILDMDYDALIAEDFSIIANWRGEEYYRFRDFANRTKMEMHGTGSQQQPFYNAAASNYSLKPSSPFIDAGIYIPGINDNYQGIAPDIGVFELR